MTKRRILYLCVEEVPYIVKTLSSFCSISVFHVGQDVKIGKDAWDLVIYQDSIVWQKCFPSFLRKLPCMFISTRTDIRGYTSSMPNLYSVINISGIDLAIWGIPNEMQLKLYPPIDKKADYYLFKKDSTTYRIVYCPTGYGVYERDYKLFSSLQTADIEVIIISDEYKALSSALPPSFMVVPQKEWFSFFRKAHLIIASGYNIVRAIALCKPCVVLGDRGLGGMVLTNNYEQLQSVYFTGRKGAYIGENVPQKLLEMEIRRAIENNYTAELKMLQKEICQKYNIDEFSMALHSEIDRIIRLHSMMKSRKKRLMLKPFVSSACKIDEIEGKKYLLCGLLCLGELEEDMFNLLRQCDGNHTIQELINRNEYDEESGFVLWNNLFDLWKVKLILFKI